MTDKKRCLAELEAAYAELLKQQDRMDRKSHADEINGCALNRLLKSMKSIEGQIEALKRDLGQTPNAPGIQSISNDVDLGGLGLGLESV